MTLVEEEKELRRLSLRAALRKYISAGTDGSRWLSQARDAMRQFTGDEFYICVDAFVVEGVLTVKRGRLGGERLSLVDTKEKEQGNGQ
jgi:hypothetical protein